MSVYNSGDPKYDTGLLKGKLTPTIAAPEAAGLFPQAIETNGVNTADNVIDSITDQVYANHTKRRDAIYKGKSSKATVNIEKIANQTGIPVSVIDRAVGMGTMASLGSKEDARAAIAQVIKAYNSESSTASEPAGQKQPWEMTAEEFNVLPKFKQNIKAKSFGLPTDRMEKYTPYDKTGVYSKDRNLHKDIVQQAISEGKIKSHTDYPELNQSVDGNKEGEKETKLPSIKLPSEGTDVSFQTNEATPATDKENLSDKITVSRVKNGKKVSTTVSTEEATQEVKDNQTTIQRLTQMLDCL